jgi:hypothetical protein
MYNGYVLGWGKQHNLALLQQQKQQQQRRFRNGPCSSRLALQEQKLVKIAAAAEAALQGVAMEVAAAVRSWCVCRSICRS